MKFIYISIIFFIVLGCSSSQKVVIETKCPQIYKNDFTEILNEKYETVYNKDTIAYNEIRFECVFSAFYTHKVMYDKFGKWSKVIYPSNRKHPILMWKNVDLFSNGKKYNVLTNGIEEWKHIYASVMVFDEKNIDLLFKDSPEKESITNYFASLIRNNKSKKKEFYNEYWDMVEAKQVTILKKQKINSNTQGN